MAMRGHRGAVGIINPNQEKIEGIEHVGDPNEAVLSWGGAKSQGPLAPSIAANPRVTLPIDPHDLLDLYPNDTSHRVDQTARRNRNSTLDNTWSRFRTQYRTLANHIAWLMDLARGTRSFKALVADGTGGATVAGAAGTVKVSAAAAGTSTPTPALAGKGVLYKELVPLAWGIFAGGVGGALKSGVNISAFSRSSTGQYSITLVSGWSVSANVCVVATPYSSAAPATIAYNVSGTTFIAFLTFNSSGAAADSDVSFVVYGA